MDQLVLNIVGGLIVVVIAAWLGIGSKSERVVFVGGGNSKKKWWKKFIVFAWLMIVLGIILYGANAPTTGNAFLGAQMDVWGYLGLDLIGFGIIFLIIGKISLWVVG